MDKDDKKAAPVQPAKPAAPAPEPVKEEPKKEEAAPAPEAELSAPTLTEGRVDELEHLRNEQGQLSPEDGSSPDELSDALKAKFSGHGGGDF